MKEYELSFKKRFMKDLKEKFEFMLKIYTLPVMFVIAFIYFHFNLYNRKVFEILKNMP